MLAEPFKTIALLTDNHGRLINYLRLAVTDRCNLRCFYCMPEEGIQWLERKELMTYEELLRLCTLVVRMGVTKIRLTGGEPFVRKDIMQFVAALTRLDGLQQLAITTNGVATAPLVPELKKLGVHSVNLSLDTLDRDRFLAITHRDELPKVLDTLEQLLRYNLPTKVNAVVMDGKNIADIPSLVALAKDLPIQVRLIEEMPFNGDAAHYTTLPWDHLRILEQITEHYPGIQKLQDPPFSTSYQYRVPGHKGQVGIIAAYTRSFCGTCNRLRVTPQGMLKTCLYDGGVLNIRDLLREGLGDEAVQEVLLQAIASRARNGWEAEAQRVAQSGIHESMATIGG